MRKIIAAAVAVAALGTSVRSNAQTAHPSLAGKWVMDAAKSDQSPLTPQEMTYTIQQRGDQFTLVRSIVIQTGASDAKLVMGVDGKSWKNEWKQNGLDVVGTSTLAWEGNTLVIKTAVSAGGQDIQQTDRWTIAADGKTMTIERTIEAQGQQLAAKLVMNKVS